MPPLYIVCPELDVVVVINLEAETVVRLAPVDTRIVEDAACRFVVDGGAATVSNSRHLPGRAHSARQKAECWIDTLVDVEVALLNRATLIALSKELEAVDLRPPG